LVAVETANLGFGTLAASTLSSVPDQSCKAFVHVIPVMTVEEDQTGSSATKSTSAVVKRGMLIVSLMTPDVDLSPTPRDLK